MQWEERGEEILFNGDFSVTSMPGARYTLTEFSSCINQRLDMETRAFEEESCCGHHVEQGNSMWGKGEHLTPFSLSTVHSFLQSCFPFCDKVRRTRVLLIQASLPLKVDS